ncbi:DUF4169 family protein [Mesorhizobium sp. A623]
MTEIVNLRMARKHKVRTDKERQAEQNRALHGRSRAQRDSDRKAAEQAEKFIDGHRLSRDTDEQ